MTNLIIIQLVSDRDSLRTYHLQDKAHYLLKFLQVLWSLPAHNLSSVFDISKKYTDSNKNEEFCTSSVFPILSI